MMLRQIAELIPAEYRREILLTNMINTAQPSNNFEMNYLITVWRNYYEPTLNVNCGLCYVRVLGEWKKLHATLIEMEKENQLLNGVI